MTVMTTIIGGVDVDVVAERAGLTPRQTHSLRNIAASSAMENMPPPLEELRQLAEMLAGRIDFAEYRRRLGV